MSDKYRFPKCLDEEKRIVGLPIDEAIVVIGIFLVSFYMGMTVVGIVVATLSWMGLRHVKKGENTFFLLFLGYWVLPKEISGVLFMKTPTSKIREWVA